MKRNASGGADRQQALEGRVAALRGAGFDIGRPSCRVTAE
jgi:hypothetical protein